MGATFRNGRGIGSYVLVTVCDGVFDRIQGMLLVLPSFRKLPVRPLALSLLPIFLVGCDVAHNLCRARKRKHAPATRGILRTLRANCSRFFHALINERIDARCLR